MSGLYVTDHRACLMVENPSRWRRAWCTVVGGTDSKRFDLMIRPRGVIVAGPFEEHTFVSYSGSKYLNFRLCHVPGEPSQASP